jgi:hypothetical protein
MEGWVEMVEERDTAGNIISRNQVGTMLYPGTVVPAQCIPHIPLVEGTKYDEQKPPMELIPPLALEAEARVLDYGRNKYAAWNWAKGINQGRLLGAALRHIYQYLRGEDIDPESGHPHLAHAAWMVHFALEQQMRPAEFVEFDDRHKWKESR